MMAGSLDEETAQTLNSGRAALGAGLKSLQRHLQKVFIVFVIALFVGIIAMREYVWPQLKADLLIGEQTDVIAQTPFDVILLQVKVGLVVGILAAVPTLLFVARNDLRQAGIFRRVDVSRWKAAVVGTLIMALFIGGVLYGYYLFFPITFSFLATNATNAGLAPTYSIVLWTEFILFLALSFGLAAQLPLAMPALAYSGVIPYETFRDRWKYAIVGIFGFGAFFSPPDPFTQLLWAAPLVILYGFSLYLTKIVVTAKRRRGQINVARTVRSRWNVLAGLAVLAGGGTFLFLTAGGATLVNSELLPLFPAEYRPAPFRPIDESWGLGREISVIIATVAVTVGSLVLTVLYAVYRDLTAAGGQAPADPRDPSTIDLESLDAAGVKAAPEEAFVEMEEPEALSAARSAMEADQPEKAEAILDRFDDAETPDEETGEEETTEDTADEEEENIISSTAKGMAGAFTGEDTDDEEIGGYYYDLRFILDSLRSRVFRIVLVFGLVMSGSFLLLYSGGIGALYDDFLARLPPGVTQEQIDFSVITLHPVEALIFMVKLSVVLGAISVLPVVLYYAWPALSQRGLVTGDRRYLSLWGGGLLIGLVAGSAIGYLFVAPEVISWLVYDAIREGMSVTYRVSSFFWLIFLLTVGIGLLADIPISMILFHVTGLVEFSTMRRGWKVFVLGSLTLAALLTPGSVYTMLVVAIPMTLAYGFGLLLLWLGTLGRRAASPAPPGSN